MARMNWERARPRKPTEPAFPKDRANSAMGQAEASRLCREIDSYDRSEAGSSRVSAADIEAARSPAGGWRRATLAKWGVPWPPPKGWRKALIDGRTIPAQKAIAAPAVGPGSSTPYSVTLAPKVEMCTDPEQIRAFLAGERPPWD